MISFSQFLRCLLRSRLFRAAILVSFLVVCSGASLPAQVSQTWETSFPGFTPAAMAIDSAGNIYVTGTQCITQGPCGPTDSAPATSFRSLTIKYDPAGHELWEAPLNGPVNAARGIDIALDSDENVYVLSDAFRTSGNGFPLYNQIETAKYSPNGTQQWLKIFNDDAVDLPRKLAVGRNVYVVGNPDQFSTTGNLNVVTIKYDLNGNQLWTKVLTGNERTADVKTPLGLALDGAENIYEALGIGTHSAPMVSGADIRSVSIYKYDSGGNLLKQFGSDKLGNVMAFEVTSAGRIYVGGRALPQTGGGGGAPLAASYSTDGSLMWLHDFGSSEIFAAFVGIAADPGGNLFTARIVGTNLDLSLAKLGASDGSLIWQSKQNGPFVPNVSIVWPVPLAANSNGDVYLTAASAAPAAPPEIFTAKYDGMGNQVWAQRYSGGSNGDSPTAMELGTNGRLLVAGTDVKVYADLPDGGTGATIEYTEGPTGPSITVLPSTLTFSSTVGTASAAQSVTVENRSTSTLTIKAAPSITGANATDFVIAGTTTCVNGAIVAPGKSCVIDVTFKPTATGSRTASLAVTDSDASSPQSVRLAGTGVAAGSPLLTFSPTSLTFAGQPVGTTSAAQNITLANSGGATLNISSITITGANAADFATGTITCGKTLGAGANCVVPVTFKPSVQGDRSATMTVADDEAGSPQTLNLAGKGAGIALTCSQASASVNAGQTATYQVNVTPTAFNGSVNLTCSGAPGGVICTIAPASVTLSGDTPAPVTVTVTTKARSGLIPTIPLIRFDRVTWITISLLFSILFIMVWSFGWRWKTSFALLTLLALSLVGCAGATSNSGTNPTPSPVGGTPAGTSTLTLNATSDSAKATLPLVLTVN